MNVDAILACLNSHQVEYLLVGGMNFLLRHKPVLTFDVDVWIHDTPGNRGRCERALASMTAEWGATESEWGPVSNLPEGWLSRQPVFCLVTQHGPLDVFRRLDGVPSWKEALAGGVECRTAAGVVCTGISDADMLRCQEALGDPDRKPDRIAYLRRVLQEGDSP
jgi:hypothetical protein